MATSLGVAPPSLRCRFVPTYPFLSDDWFTAVRGDRRRARRRRDPAARRAHDEPGGDRDAVRRGPSAPHRRQGRPRRLGRRARRADADLTLTTDYATAREIFMSGNPQAGMQAFMEGKVKVQGDLTKLMAAQVAGHRARRARARRRALRDHGVTGAGASASARHRSRLTGSTSRAGSSARGRASGRDRLVGTGPDARPAGRSRSPAGTARASRSRRARVATWILPVCSSRRSWSPCVSRPGRRRSNLRRVTHPTRCRGQKNERDLRALVDHRPRGGVLRPHDPSRAGSSGCRRRSPALQRGLRGVEALADEARAPAPSPGPCSRAPSPASHATRPVPAGGSVPITLPVATVALKSSTPRRPMNPRSVSCCAASSNEAAPATSGTGDRRGAVAHEQLQRRVARRARAAGRIGADHRVGRHRLVVLRASRSRRTRRARASPSRRRATARPRRGSPPAAAPRHDRARRRRRRRRTCPARDPARSRRRRGRRRCVATMLQP